jgi:hypothetical protein
MSWDSTYLPPEADVAMTDQLSDISQIKARFNLSLREVEELMA